MIDCSRTENYFSEKRRMTKHKLNGCSYICELKCTDCPLSRSNNGASDTMPCFDFEAIYPEKAIAIVQKWSNEHPQKTYLTEFLKHYPNVLLYENGTPMSVTPCDLGLMSKGECQEGGDCIKCWHTIID